MVFQSGNVNHDKLCACCAPPSKCPEKAAPGGKTVRSKSSAGKRAKTSVINVAIATELAPAVAIALPDKTQQPPGAAAPALDCLAAGAVPSETDGKMPVQLVFENGAVLPVEMSNAAGAALSEGLARGTLRAVSGCSATPQHIRRYRPYLTEPIDLVTLEPLLTGLLRHVNQGQ